MAAHALHPARRLPRVAAGGLLLALTLLAYLPALRNGFVWDDDHYVTANLELRTPAGLASIWLTPGSPAHTYQQYYPLVHTTYWVEYHLWGLQPFGYHLVNVLLHALGAVLLWRVLETLQVPAAWFAAAVFALHPVQVESVAWITERKNVLCGVFYFGAALAWLRFAGLDAQRPEAQRPDSRGRWRWYGATLAAFTCALLSKTVACTFPVAALLVLFWKRGRVAARDVALLLPFLLLGLALGLMTAHLERVAVGAVGAEWDLSFVERTLIAARALWFYAGKLAWPATLTFIYPRWTIDTGQWWQWLFVAAALAVPVAQWLARRRLGRGPLVATLLFAVTLGPALGFVNVYPMRYSFVADHFQYLASAALIALAAAGGARLAARFGTAPAALLAAATLGLLATLTWRQARAYANEDTLWHNTLANNPDCWIAHNNLGLSLAQQGRMPEAIGHFEQALRANPRFENAHNNLGTAKLKLGLADEGLAHLREALRIDPNYAEAHANLGNALMVTGQQDEAVAHFEQALRLLPDDADAHYNFALALTVTGRAAESIEHFERALALRPDLPDARSRLGVTLAQLGRFPEAIAVLQADAQARPGDPAALDALAGVLHDSGDAAAALATWNEALRIEPDFTPALDGLAWLLATTDDPRLADPARAVQLAERAGQLARRPKASLLQTLAAAYAAAGRFDDAVAAAQQALALAQASQQESRADAIAAQLELYRAHRGFTERR